MRIIFEMYISLMPVIFAGIFNMVWVKIPFFQFANKPIDQKCLFVDGKRLLGDNKTWKGFLGMIVLGMLSTLFWGFICGTSPYLDLHNYLYRNHENTMIYNLIMGFFLGLAYALFELPNSFLKRRLDIVPGKRGTGVKSIFILIDQADSLLGCVLVISIVYHMSLLFYFCYVFIGAMTHIIINILLYLGKLRRNIF